VKIHALSTGTVRLKHVFLFARQGLRRQLSLFTPGPFSEPMPMPAGLAPRMAATLAQRPGAAQTVSVRDPTER
jgi:hypothetical protein